MMAEMRWEALWVQRSLTELFNRTVHNTDIFCTYHKLKLED